MDIEQVKLIVQAVGGVSDDAKQLITVYLILMGAEIVFKYFLGGMGIFVAYRLIRNLIAKSFQ